MFFIFGWGKQTVQKYGPVHKYHCERCKNDEFWELYSRKTWFTLFFIPVIPYSFEYLLVCPVCSSGIQLDRKKFDELKEIAWCNVELIDKRITPEVHATRIKQLLSPGENTGSVSQEPEMMGKTETQINYLRQMREIEEERARKQEKVETKE